MAPSADKLLSIYLNDHLAGATAGLEVAKRAAGSNRDRPLGAVLEDIASQLEWDREQLKALIEALGFGTDRLKVLGGWAGEKVGRLKLNGELLSYSPLSRVIELEGLRIGVEGKLCLWSSLRKLSDPRIAEAIDLDLLIERGTEQRRVLERERLRAVTEAMASETVRA